MNSIPDPAVLPDELEYTGEFGPELVLFLPFIRWLAKTGRLGDRVVRTYSGMAPFYSGLGIRHFEEKTARREWVAPDHRPWWLPVKNEHSFDGLGRPDQHLYPDFRAQFLKTPIAPKIEERIKDKPLLIIHNKYNVEWESGPINFIGLQTLDQAFRLLKRRFTVLYVRHGLGGAIASFSDDHNNAEHFRDWDVLSAHPEIVEFERNFACSGEENINLAKSALYARSHRFITSQGGGAAQIALFSGSLISVIHRSGREQDWGYAPGYYSFMADPPPRILTSTTDAELRATFPLFEHSQFHAGRVFLDPADERVARRLDPLSLPRRAAVANRAKRVRSRVASFLKRGVLKLLP